MAVRGPVPGWVLGPVPRRVPTTGPTAKTRARRGPWPRPRGSARCRRESGGVACVPRSTRSAGPARARFRGGRNPVPRRAVPRDHEAEPPAGVRERTADRVADQGDEVGARPARPRVGVREQVGVAITRSAARSRHTRRVRPGHRRVGPTPGTRGCRRLVFVLLEQRADLASDADRELASELVAELADGVLGVAGRLFALGVAGVEGQQGGRGQGRKRLPGLARDHDDLGPGQVDPAGERELEGRAITVASRPGAGARDQDRGELAARLGPGERGVVGDRRARVELGIRDERDLGLSDPAQDVAPGLGQGALGHGRDPGLAVELELVEVLGEQGLARLPQLQSTTRAGPPRSAAGR